MKIENSKEDIKKIAANMLAVLKKRLASLEITAEFDESALTAIADAGFDPVYGARPLKRYMQSQLETMLARKIVAAEILPGQRVVVDAGENGLTVQAEQNKLN